jgi:hypothetical protein
MLVCNKDSVDRLRIDADDGQPLERFLAAKTSVDKDAGSLSRDQRRVAGTG